MATDPGSGKPHIGSTESDAVLGGAMLYDLVSLDRLGSTARAARPASWSSPPPVPDPALEAAFARVRDRKPAKAQNLVARLGKHGQKNLYRVLAEQTASCARATSSSSASFPLTRHDVLDRSPARPPARPDPRSTSARPGAGRRDRPADRAALGRRAGEVRRRQARPQARQEAAPPRSPRATGPARASQGGIQAARAAMTAAVVALQPRPPPVSSGQRPVSRSPSRASRLGRARPASSRRSAAR